MTSTLSPQYSSLLMLKVPFDHPWQNYVSFVMHLGVVFFGDSFMGKAPSLEKVLSLRSKFLQLSFHEFIVENVPWYYQIMSDFCGVEGVDSSLKEVLEDDILHFGLSLNENLKRLPKDMSQRACQLLADLIVFGSVYQIVRQVVVKDLAVYEEYCHKHCDNGIVGVLEGLHLVWEVFVPKACEDMMKVLIKRRTIALHSSSSRRKMFQDGIPAVPLDFCL